MSRVTKTKKPQTLAAHVAAWEKRLKRGMTPKLLAKLLGRLTYDHESLRLRLQITEEDAAETWLVIREMQETLRETASRLPKVRKPMAEGKDGMIMFRGAPHLRECRVITHALSITTVCDCGSVGPREAAKKPAN